MTAFRLFFCACCSVLLLAIPGVSGASGVSITPATDQVTQLEQQNADLQRQVRRLTHEVAALREEFDRPHASQVIGGIGYIVGLFGVAAWFAARQKKRRKD